MAQYNKDENLNSLYYLFGIVLAIWIISMIPIHTQCYMRLLFCNYSFIDS
jgi:hypothetical protein